MFVTKAKKTASHVQLWLGMTLMIGLLAACARAPDLIGIDNPDLPVASVQDATLRKVFIISTRASTETAGALFSSERSPELGLASVQVSIPPTHVVGELERPKRLPPDPRTEFAVIDPSIYSKDSAFVRSINDELAKLPPGSRNILFFVHGYNNTTSDAVLRLAQFVNDSDFTGVPVLFDWASAASASRYVYDLNSALIARTKIEEVGTVLSQARIDRYDIFAHSMGSFLTMEAIVAQTHKGRFDRPQKLRNIILASPDIDMDLFRTQIKLLDPDQLNRFFVLLSKDDAALRVSRRISGGVPRVGATDAQELADLGIVAIDLSEVSDSASGSHSKFAGSPEVVQLIGNGLNQNSTFDRRRQSRRLGDVLRGVPITVVFD